MTGSFFYDIIRFASELQIAKEGNTLNAIEIKNLTVSYGETPALNDISVDIEERDFVGIMGPNGGGKSTLLKSILGLIPIKTGEIKIMGDSSKKAIHQIGYVPQFSNMDRSFPITVLETVLCGMLSPGLHPFQRFSKEMKEKAMGYLKMVSLDDLYKRQISSLSGGEFQRLLLARALASDPNLLMLDEPTAAVDPASKELIYELLENLNEKKTIVLVTHDLMTVASNVKRIICINRGLIYHGEPNLTESVVEQLYNCPVDLIAHGVPHRVLGDHCCDHNHGHGHHIDYKGAN